MDTDSQPLIEEKGELDDFAPVRHLKEVSKQRYWTKAIASHSLVAIATFLVFTILNVRGIMLPSLKTCKARPSIYSPMTVATEYVIDEPPEDYWANELYFGPPTEESEEAWDEMIFPHGLQVFPDEAKHFDKLDTVKLKSGNPLFIMGVNHNLHCLRRIRQTLRADHYYPNETDEWRQIDLHHTQHCLESIRTSVLCHPDFTPNRFYWSGRQAHDLSVAPNVKRECVNWDRVTNFLRERTYNPDDTMHGGVTHREYEGRTGREKYGCEWNDSC